MKKLPKIALSLYCITLALFCQAFLFNAPVSAADPQDFEFENFTADYYLSRDDEGIGHLRVVERLTAYFPTDRDQNHGITRIIPFTNQAGKNLTIPDLDRFTVKARHNNAPVEPYSIDRENGYFEVRLGSPDSYVHGRQIYELEYEFENVITDFENYQELYWDTNGVDWAQPFDSLTVRVHIMDDELRAAFTGQAWCYVGTIHTKGSERCEILQNGDGVEFRTSNLRPRENLTFDLEFQPGTFTIADPPVNYTLLAALIIELLVAAAIFAYTVYAYRRVSYKRQFYKSLFTAPQYTPPSGLTVAEAGYAGLADHTGTSKVATLLELAVQNKIELIQNDQKNSKKPLWTIRIKSTDLSPEQKTVLQILHGQTTPLTVDEEFVLRKHTPSTKLTSLIAHFGSDVARQAYQKGLMESAQVSGVKVKASAEEKICNRLAGASALWAFFGVTGFAIMESSLPEYGIIFGRSGGEFGLIETIMIVILLLAFFVPLISSIFLSRYAARTEKGLRIANYLDGLKLYIKMAEKDRLAFFQSVKGVDTSHQGIVNLYEKLLPYAALFNLEKSWLKEMGRYYEYDDVAAPTWYSGYDVFSAYVFSQALTNATTSAQSSIISASPSSSSSGSSGGGGGGFSGGGGGGGGGGGW